MSRRRALSVDPLFVVNRFVDAANRHDAEAVAACVHRDFESLQPIHPVRNFRGSAQLLANWRAIFRNEPGFRLTMLRSVVDDDTVWVELHGAGDQAEVAGVFIVGVENGLIRWARVYSELVEPLPEPVVEAVPAAVPGDGAGSREEPVDGAGGALRRLRLVEEGEEAAGRSAEAVAAIEAELTAEEVAAKEEAVASEAEAEPEEPSVEAGPTSSSEEATTGPAAGRGRRRFGKRQRRK